MIRLPDSILGVVFALLGVVVILTSAQMPRLGDLPVGPGLMPMLLGFGFVICGLGLAIQRLPELKEVAAGRLPILERGENLLFFIAVPLLLLVYVLLFEQVGFVPLTFAFVAAVAWVGRATIIASLAFAAATTAVIYVVFVHLLRVPLPPGAIFG